MFNNAMKSMWKAVWEWLKGLLVTEGDEWMTVCAWILKIVLGVTQKAALEVLQKIKTFVVEAAEHYPSRGTGDQKWMYVWEAVKAEMGEWLEAHGMQTMELIVLALVKLLTVRGMKT